MQVLRLASRGSDVRRIQQALNRCMLPPNNPFTSPPLQRLVEDDGDTGLSLELGAGRFGGRRHRAEGRGIEPAENAFEFAEVDGENGRCGNHGRLRVSVVELRQPDTACMDSFVGFAIDASERTAQWFAFR